MIKPSEQELREAALQYIQNCGFAAGEYLKEEFMSAFIAGVKYGIEKCARENNFVSNSNK